MKIRLLLTLLAWVSTFAKGQTNFPLLISDQWLTEKAKQVIRFSIGDFLVAAHNNTTFTAGEGIHLSRYQSNGQVLWQKTGKRILMYLVTMNCWAWEVFMQMGRILMF